MIYYFALALSHGLLVFALWQLLWRDDLDDDPPESKDVTNQPEAPAGKTKPGLRLRA